MERGVASLADTIFLILIATLAAGMILQSGLHYGETANEYLTQLMLDYYAKQTLRVISSVSIQRECGVDDYLLAYLKERAEKDPKNILDLTARGKLKETINNALEPLGDAYDYVFILDFGERYEKAFVVGRRHIIENGTVYEEDISCVYKDQDKSTIYSTLEKLSNPYASSTVFFFRMKNNNTYEYVPVEAGFVLWPAGDPQAKEICK